MARNHSDGVYTRDDRAGYWITWTDHQGKRKFRKTNATTLAQARAARGAELVRVEQAKILGFNPPGTETFAELSQRFLAYQKARVTPQEYERERLIVNTHLASLFSGKLSTIRRVDIESYRTKRSNQVGPATVRREMAALKQMLSKAVEWELLPMSPAQGVKLPKPPAGRLRYLHPGELQAVILASPEWLRPIVGLAASTGMRRGEILGVRWLDLDLVHGRLMLPQTKNGDGRIVYLNESARAVIRSLPFDTETKATDTLFEGISAAQVSVTFGRACSKVKLEDFRFHDLRHTAASWLRMKGADIHTVAQLLGHKDLRMTQRYSHLSSQFLADAVKGLDAVFGDLRYQGVTEIPEKAGSVASPTGFEPVLPH